MTDYHNLPQQALGDHAAQVQRHVFEQVALRAQAEAF